jgi:hypothetical protein
MLLLLSNLPKFPLRSQAAGIPRETLDDDGFVFVLILALLYTNDVLFAFYFEAGTYCRYLSALNP